MYILYDFSTMCLVTLVQKKKDRLSKTSALLGCICFPLKGFLKFISNYCLLWNAEALKKRVESHEHTSHLSL